VRSRWVIEGEWSGYRSGQQRIVHREVTSDPARAEWVNKTHGIRYSDGTMLYMSCRLMEKGERLKAGLINSYGSLISDCVRHNVDSVDALCEKRKGAQA